MSTTREIHLASRPTGWPEPDNFRLVEKHLPDLVDGQVLVRNLVMSVDPYMRGRMDDRESYVAPFTLDRPLVGGAVGEVVESRADGFAEGDLVLHGLGWREHAVVPSVALDKLDRVPGVAPSAYLGPLGMIGLTAYAGLLDVAKFTPGDTVFVSGAAGAVGSLVGQIAKRRGAARVIGSAGSAAKVEHVTGTLGFDAAFNYRDGDVRDLLAAAAPDGIDVYFDNVGGDHLEAALDVLKLGGRIAACGAISQYNDVEPTPGPRNLFQFIAKRLTMRGFICDDHSDLVPVLTKELGGWLAEGSIHFDETVVHGLENAPSAFLDMMRGQNLGKMLVTLTS